MNILNFNQGEDDWKAWRKTVITATDAATILGINPYKTRYKLWQQKLGLIPDDEANEAMKEGSRLEPIARELFIKETGIHIEPMVGVHDEYNWIGASFDGVTGDHKMAVEIKCSRKIYEKALNLEIDPMYRAQMLHQMFVADIKQMIFMAYWDGKYKLIYVQRDTSDIEEMFHEEEKFYHLLQSFTEPELTDKDFIIRDDDDWEFDSMRWKHAKENLEHWKKAEEFLREQLIKQSNRQSSIGAGIKITHSSRRAAIDYSLIPELKNIDLEKYRKKRIETWTISEI